MLVDVTLCVPGCSFQAERGPGCTSTQQCLSNVMLPFFSFRSSLM